MIFCKFNILGFLYIFLDNRRAALHVHLFEHVYKHLYEQLHAAPRRWRGAPCHPAKELSAGHAVNVLVKVFVKIFVKGVRKYARTQDTQYIKYKNPKITIFTKITTYELWNLYIIQNKKISV